MKKKIVIAILVMIAAASCKRENYTGYIVYKEYTPQHMSDKTAYSHSVAMFNVPYIPHPVITHKPAPTLVHSSFVFYIANKDGVETFRVDTATFINHKCGEKITMYFK